MGIRRVGLVGKRLAGGGIRGIRTPHPLPVPLSCVYPAPILPSLSIFTRPIH